MFYAENNTCFITRIEEKPQFKREIVSRCTLHCDLLNFIPCRSLIKIKKLIYKILNLLTFVKMFIDRELMQIEKRHPVQIDM